MRLGGLLRCLVVVHCSLIYHVSADNQLNVRQELTTTTQQSQDGSQTISQAITTASGIISSIISNPSSNSTSVLVHPSTNTTTGAQPTSTNSTVGGDPPLPLQPTISPANVLAGIFLLIPGFVYGFFSIKHQLLHNFLSVSFVGALAVACLIVFVEDPGSGTGQQVGYVLGSVLSGVLMGGFSSPFAGIFEGLGCFLAGFCLSMWLLTIKDDGLMQNRAGKTILITSMSLAIGALGFHRFTRHRALLVCIPFSAATAIILGIDCFTRGGYKEFWIYVWGFNMNLFPLNTDSYPVTRTIRVESSCIIVIFLIGCIVNTKLWKILQRRVSEENTERKKKEMDLEKMESQVGLRTELEVAKEKRAWEKTYGPQKSTTAVTSRAISSESYKRSSRGSDDRPLSEANTIEMLEMDLANDFGVPVHTAPRRISQGAGITIKIQEMRDYNNNPAKTSRTLPKQDATTSDHRKDSEVPSGPEVIPLPFPVGPSKPNRTSGKSPNRTSFSTEESFRDVGANPTSNPLGRVEIEPISDGEPDSDDDAVSSLEANLDDLDKRSVSTHSWFSKEGLSRDLSSSREPEEIPLPESRNTSRSGSICDATERPSISDRNKSSHAAVLLTPEPNQFKDLNNAGFKSPASQNRESLLSTQDYITSEPDTDGHPDGQSTSELTDMSLDKLKDRTSGRILRAFRQQKTFEWAKQSTLAETPPLEEITRPSSPGILPEVNRESQVQGKSRSKVVGLEEMSLSNQAGDVQEPCLPQSMSATTSPRQSLTDPTATPDRRSSRFDTQMSTPTLGTTQRSFSNPTSPRGSVMALCESPIEEEDIDGDTYQVALPHKSETLLGKREQNLKKRLSANALTGMPVSAFSRSSPNILSSLQTAGQPGFPPVNRAKSPSPAMQSENYISTSHQSYSRQKTYPSLQQSNVSSPALALTSPKRQSAICLTPDVSQPGNSNRSSVYLPDIRARRISQQNVLGEFDSHQPQRQNDKQTREQRAARLASWRVSLQTDSAKSQPSAGVGAPSKLSTGAINAHREQMIREKKTREQVEIQQGVERVMRDQAIDRSMRAPDAIALHSKRLSEMQARVKMG